MAERSHLTLGGPQASLIATACLRKAKARHRSHPLQPPREFHELGAPLLQRSVATIYALVPGPSEYLLLKRRSVTARHGISHNDLKAIATEV